MMEAEVGKGKIIWACAPFESTSLTQPRKVFTSFVKKYVPEMSFASDDTPYVVEYQLWEDEEGKYGLKQHGKFTAIDHGAVRQSVR